MRPRLLNKHILSLIILLMAGIAIAKTVSLPVSVAIPQEGRVGETRSNPVSVAIPQEGRVGETRSNPVSVAFPSQAGGGYYLVNQVSVGYQKEPLSDPDVVSLWRFDGDWNDASANDKTAIPFGGATFTTTDKKLGSSAAVFNGSNAYLTVGNLNGKFPARSFTLESWVKLSSIANGERRAIAGGVEKFNDYAFGIINNKFTAWVGNGSATTHVDSGVVPVLGQWYHLAATYDGSRLRIYVDGVKKGDVAATWLQGDVNFWIANEACCTSRYLSGTLDELTVYRRALTDAEIAYDYKAAAASSAIATPTVNETPSIVGSGTILLSGTKAPDTAIWVNKKEVVPFDNMSSWQGNYGQLSSGTNVLTIAAVDGANQQSLPVSRTIIYDNTAPTILSSEPANGSNFGTPISSITIKLIDSYSPVDIAKSLENAVVTNADGTSIAGEWSSGEPGTLVFVPTTAPLPADNYTVTIRPADSLGNIGTASIRFSTIDTNAPAVTITPVGTRDVDGWYLTPVIVTLSADDGSTGSGIKLIEYSLDGETWTQYLSPITITDDGLYTLMVRAADFADVVSAPKTEIIRINKLGLVGLWHMDNDWNDSSLALNHAVAAATTIFSGAGKIGSNSGGFDGVDDYLEVKNSLTLNPVAITVEAWAKSTTANWNSSGSLVSKRDAYILHPVQDTKEIRFYIYSNGAWRYVGYTDPSLDITAWHHYAGTFDGSSLNIYIDGELKNSVYYAGPINTGDAGPLFIGRDDGQPRYFNGAIDEVAIYKRALNAGEIREHYLNYAITPPTVEPVASPTTSSTVTFTGTKPAGTAVVVNGAELVPLDDQTSWQATYELVPGTNIIKITAKDAQGLNSQPTTISVAWDNSAPVVASSIPANGGYYGQLVSRVIINLSDIFSPIDLEATLVNASLKDGSGFVISGDWAIVGSGTTAAATFTPFAALGEGSYTATLYPADTLGNKGTVTVTFTVDTTSPDVPVIDPPPQLIAAKTITVTGSRSMDSTTVAVTCSSGVVGTVTYPTPTTWRVTITNLQEGTNSLAARALDAAGNSSSAANAAFTVDTTPPAKPVIDAPVSPTNATSVVLSGTKEANTTLFINSKATSASFASTSWQETVSLNEGTNNFSVYLKDAAGNAGQSASVIIVRDTKAPTIASATPSTVVGTADTVAVTFADGAGVNIEASLAGAVLKDGAGTIINGTWGVTGTAIVFTPTSLPLPEGAYTATLYPVDNLGNKGSVTFGFTIDRAPPAAQSLTMSPTSPHKAETVTFSILFTEQMDTTVQPAVTIVRPGIIFNTTYTLTGSWLGDAKTWRGSYTFTTDTGDGTYAVKVKGAKDRAANPMAEQEVGSFILDTTPPASPTANSVTTPTKTATQVLSGTKPADTALIINNIQRIAINSATDWSYAYPLAEGSNKLTIVARDAAGNDSAQVTPEPVITLDTTPPLFTIDSYQSPSPSATQFISGKKEPGCIVTLNGTVLFDAADQNGTWSKEITLTEGVSNRLAFTAADALGNTISRTIEIVYDIAPPAPLGAGMLAADGNGSGTTVQLNWASYIEPADLAYYRIYVSTNPVTSLVGLVPLPTTVTKGTKTFTVKGLTAGTTYYFAVVPVDGSGNYENTASFASAVPIDTAPPEDVTGLTAWASYSATDGNFVTLTWTASKNSSGDLADQILFVDAGNGYNSGISIGHTTTSYTLNQLADEKLYRFKIAVKDNLGHQSSGASAQAMTRLANPTGIKGTAGNQKVVVSWNPVNSPYVKLYNLYRKKGDIPLTDVSSMTLIRSQSSTSYTDTGLENGATYQYAVTVVNTSGAERSDVQTIGVIPQSDTVGPVISGITVIPNQVLTAPHTIAASAADAESNVSRLELWIDGVLVKSQTGSSVNYFWNLVDSTDGNHTVTIRAFDSLDNVSEVAVPVVVSLALPAVPKITGHTVTQTSPTYTVSISGNAPISTNIVTRLNGVVVNQSTATSDAGNFTVTGISLVEGDNLISVKAVHRGGESIFSTDYKILVDTGAPNPPTNLMAAPLPGGVVQLTWQRGAGEIPTGFNLYENSRAFTSISEPGVKKVTDTPITYTFRDHLAADDALKYYAVTALDGAGNQSALSNVISLSADRTPPAVSEIKFSRENGTSPGDGVYGPGKANVALLVTEPLKEIPYLSLEPQLGAPIVVPLIKIDERRYQGSFSIDASVPSGNVIYRFSGKDGIGNRGTSTGNAFIIDTKGPVASIAAPKTLLQTTAGLAAVKVSFDEPSTSTPVLDLKAVNGTTAPVIGLVSYDGGVNWSGTVDPSTLPEGNAQFFLVDSQDRFGNKGTGIVTGNILLYKDVPPSPAVPEGVSAISEKGGFVKISWPKVSDAQGYKIYRRGDGDIAPVLVETISDNATYTFTDIPPTDGTYSYSVTAIGLIGTESLHSKAIIAVSDRVAPSSPTALQLSLSGSGVQAVWEAPSDGATSYKLYKSDGVINSPLGATVAAVSDKLAATDPAPAKTKSFYAVTAVDAVGNESTPSATEQIVFPVAPVSELTLSRVDYGKPSLSWKGESGVQGYYIYRNGNRINSTPTTSSTYTDGYYSGGAVTYAVSAVTGGGIESPRKEVTLPVLTIGLKEGTTFRRGVLETIPIVISLSAGQTGSLAVNTVKVKIGSLLESTLSGPFTILSGTPFEISKVAATDVTAPPQVAVVATAVINPSPGVTVEIINSSLATVIGSGTALELFNEPLVRGTTGKVRIKVNNLGSARTEFITSENNGPSSHVQVHLKDEDGNVLGKGSLNQRTGEVVNSGNYATARLEPGQSFVSEPITFNVPSLAPGKVVIEAVVANTYYHYYQPDQVVAPGLRQSLETVIADVPYYALVATDKAFYKQGEVIKINGQVKATGSGQPVPTVPVRIGVSVSGFDRFFNATTDQNGAFTYSFTPGSNEAGSYSVWAQHPDLTGRNIQAEFSIIGLTMSPTVANVTIRKGQSVDIPVTLSNIGGSTLTGLSFTPQSSSGFTASIVQEGLADVKAGESRKLLFRVAADTTAPETGIASLGVTTDQGLGGTLHANLKSFNAIPLISTAPTYLDTGIVRGTQRLESFTIRNTGFETLKNARLEGPSLPWLSLAINRSLGDIAPGDGRSVGLLVKPDEFVQQGIYDDRIVIYSDNHIPYTYNIQVTVTSNAVGSVQFMVLNELLEQLAGATITLQNQSLTEIMFTLKTAKGSAAQPDIPEGRYRFNVSAPGHVPYSGSFVITPGLVTTVPVSLEVNMVNVEWSVTPTVIQDKYEIKITQTFETNVPAPVLVVEPANINIPNMKPGEVLNGEFTVTNYGLIGIYDVELNFPTSFGDYDIEVLTRAVPDRIDAMQKVTIPYRITRRVQSAGLNSYGGDCYQFQGISIKGKCVICPNTAAARIVDKAVNFILSFFMDCGSGGGSGGGWTGGGGSFSGGGATGTWMPSGGGSPGASPSPLPSGDCECMNCDDQNACTEDSCSGGACINTPKNCNDGDPCTLDFCGAGGCENPPVVCDDGNPCTDDTCGAGGCESTPKDCDDGDPCTDDSCGPNGCVNVPKNCDDGNGCTVDTCDAGACKNTHIDQIPDDPTDCVNKRCVDGNIVSDPDNGETPPKGSPNDCKTEICKDGSATRINDDSEKPLEECKVCKDGAPAAGPDRFLSNDADDDCVSRYCVKGEIQSRPNDSETPPQASDIDCKKDICREGRKAQTNDDSQNPSCQTCKDGVVIPMNTEWRTVTPQVSYPVPPVWLDGINRVLDKIPGGRINIQEAKFQMDTKKRDCCKDGDVIKDGEMQGQGGIEFKLAGRELLLWGVPSKEINIWMGGVEITVDYGLGVYWDPEFTITGMAGKRSSVCDEAGNCYFGSVGFNANAKVRATAEAILCTESIWTSKECTGLSVSPLGAEVGLNGQLSYNQDSCGTGWNIDAYLGKGSIFAEFKIWDGIEVKYEIYSWNGIQLF